MPQNIQYFVLNQLFNTDLSKTVYILRETQGVFLSVLPTFYFYLIA